MRPAPKLVRRILLAAMIVSLAWGGYELLRRQRGFAHATELAQFGLWQKARSALDGYLELHPSDAEARLLMAELWISDDQLFSDVTAPAALKQLSRIPPDAPLASTARLQEAKIQFLIQHRPVAAEASLRSAILRDENSLEAHLLLCKVLEMTARYHQTETLFWQAYDLSPAEQRPVRLREWYMSQFFPRTANDDLDRQMGFTDAETATLPVEAVRYLRFRETEPHAPLGRAALARWTARRGQPREGLSLLDAGDEKLDNELDDPFFVATLVDLLVDLGEYERAEGHFRDWPGPKEGFDYWRLQAVLLEDVDEDFEAALEAYDKALQTWPGQADWRLMHRKAGCLARAGERDQARAVRTRATEVELLMEDEVHQRLRHVLGNLNDADGLKEVAAFYRKLDRTREATAWSREVARLVAATLE